MKKILLTDCCELVMGQSPVSSSYNTEKRGLPFYQGNADFGKINPITRCWCDKPIKIAYKDDILISVRAPIGAINIASEECCIGRGLAAVRALKGKCLYEFLYYALQSNTEELKSQGTGSTFKAISKQILANSELPDITLEEQHRIVNRLLKVDTLIENANEQLRLFDQLVKSRFIEMFGDIVLNDKHHGQYILNDVCVKITDGTHDTPKRIENGYLFLTGKNIRANGIIYDEIEYVSKEVHKEIYKRCNPEYGDVLYTNIGVNYGTACLNNRTDEFSMKNIALLKPNKKILNSYYLWYCLNLMRDFILEKNQAGGAQTFMGLATIKNIKIQVPSIELQNQFASFVQQVDKSKFTHCYELLLLIIKKIWYNNYV